MKSATVVKSPEIIVTADPTVVAKSFSPLRRWATAGAIFFRALGNAGSVFLAFQFAILLNPHFGTANIPAYLFSFAAFATLGDFLSGMRRVRSTLIATAVGLLMPFIAMASIPMLYATSGRPGAFRWLYLIVAFGFGAAGADFSIFKTIEQSTLSSEADLGRLAIFVLGSLAGIFLSIPAAVNLGYFTASGFFAVASAGALVALWLSCFTIKNERLAFTLVMCGLAVVAAYGFTAEKSRSKLQTKIYRLQPL
jgi:hypothetical protein